MSSSECKISNQLESHPLLHPCNVHHCLPVCLHLIAVSCIFYNRLITYLLTFRSLTTNTTVSCLLPQIVHFDAIAEMSGLFQ